MVIKYLDEEEKKLELALLKRLINFIDLKQYNLSIRLAKKLFSFTNDLYYLRLLASLYNTINEKEKAIDTMVYYYELLEEVEFPDGF